MEYYYMGLIYTFEIRVRMTNAVLLQIQMACYENNTLEKLCIQNETIKYGH